VRNNEDNGVRGTGLKRRHGKKPNQLKERYRLDRPDQVKGGKKKKRGELIKGKRRGEKARGKVD